MLSLLIALTKDMEWNFSKICRHTAIDANDIFGMGVLSFLQFSVYPFIIFHEGAASAISCQLVKLGNTKVSGASRIKALLSTSPLKSFEFFIKSVRHVYYNSCIYAPFIVTETYLNNYLTFFTKINAHGRV